MHDTYAVEVSLIGVCLMRRMNQYEQMKWRQRLQRYEWTSTFSVTGLDATLGGLWLSSVEGLTKAQAIDPTVRYWLVGSVGVLKETPHYHGLFYCETLTVRELNKAFRGCNAPYRTPITNLEGWCNYITEQAVEDTIITNLGE